MVTSIVHKEIPFGILLIRQTLVFQTHPIHTYELFSYKDKNINIMSLLEFIQ
jgi:hypothetical protein